MKIIFFTMLVTTILLFIIKRRNKNNKIGAPINQNTSINWDEDTAHTETEL